MTTMLALPPVAEVRRIDKYGRFPGLVRTAHAVIDRAISEYKLTGVWSLFSGGHDSLVTTHVTSQHPTFEGVIHIDTGTGVPQTTQFVRDVCAQYGWRLIIQRPRTTYLQLAVEHGFPGPGQHNLMYRMLKERALRQAKKRARKITAGAFGYSTGVRLQESQRRMGHVETTRADGEGNWISPIYNWTALDVNTYMRLNALPRNPVKDHTHMSGECLCGAYAQPNEAKMWAQWYPGVAERLRKWEALVQQARELQVWEAEHGFREWDDVMDERYTRWGWKGRVADEQIEMFPLCWFCREATA
jgi:3'-phosphoadenosine 5'-phosphosulfate sulfotransferase (PAPS reductase)/FAD synthetase